MSATAPPTAAPGRPGGPVGKVRNPWGVLGLTLITFGIYGCYWWWTTSAEVDAHRGQRHAHPIMRTGILLSIAGLALYVVAFVLLIGSLAAAASAQSPGGLLAGGVLGFLLFMLAAGTLVAGAVCTLVGAWRIWSTLRDREQALGALKPLSPGWQLALMLIPYVNIVGGFVVVYRTQSHLNAMWQGRLVQ